MLMAAIMEDEQEFSKVYSKYCKKALAVTVYILGSQALGEEAAQEGWMKVAKHFKKFLSIPIEKQAAWVVTIMSNTAKDIWRREHKFTSWDDVRHDEGIPDCTEIISEHEAMVQRVAALPEPIRDVIVRRFYNQQTPGEIARDMGLKSSTVTMRMNKGLKLLREAVEKEGIEQ